MVEKRSVRTQNWLASRGENGESSVVGRDEQNTDGRGGSSKGNRWDLSKLKTDLGTQLKSGIERAKERLNPQFRESFTDDEKRALEGNGYTILYINTSSIGKTESRYEDFAVGGRRNPNSVLNTTPGIGEVAYKRKGTFVKDGFDKGYKDQEKALKEEVSKIGIDSVQASIDAPSVYMQIQDSLDDEKTGTIFPEGISIRTYDRGIYFNMSFTQGGRVGSISESGWFDKRNDLGVVKLVRPK